MPKRDNVDPRDQYALDEAELYASPRTPAYKDNSAKLIRLGAMAVLAVAVGGAIAYGRFVSPPMAEAPVAEQQDQVAFNQAAQAPAAIPEAQPVPDVAPAPAAKSAKPAPKAAPAPVPAPLADENNQPVDVDPTTPEVLSPIPGAPAGAAPGP